MARPAFDYEGLANEWDAVDELRGRLRMGKRLVDSKGTGQDSSILECKSNMAFLNPVLHKLFAAGLKLPEINPLREQCGKAYELSQREKVDGDIDQDAWDARKMMRFVKRKGSRKDVSVDARLQS